MNAVIAKQIISVCNSGRIDLLTGDHNSGRRQAVMSAVAGKRVPKAQCGVNAVCDAVYKAFEIDPDSPNRMRSQCAAVLRIMAASTVIHDEAAVVAGIGPVQGMGTAAYLKAIGAA